MGSKAIENSKINVPSNICVLVVLKTVYTSKAQHTCEIDIRIKLHIYLIIIHFKPDEMETLLARFSNCEIRGKYILNPAMTDTHQVSHRSNPRYQLYKYKR